MTTVSAGARRLAVEPPAMTSHATPAPALVLGGGGFLGTNIVDALRAEGTRVAVAHRGRALPFHLRGRVDEACRADLGDPASLRAAMRGRRVVFHAAGHYPRYSLAGGDAAVLARQEMRNALDAARDAGVERVVYTSSIAVLTRADGAVAREADVPAEPPHDSVYRAVKWHLEDVANEAAGAGLDVVTLRPGGCLGPWDMRGGTGALLAGVIRGELTWFVDGLVHLVDVRDVARAHAAAARCPRGRTYNLAGHAVRVRALFERVASRHGGASPALALGADDARARATEEERAAAAARIRAPLPREMVDIALAGCPASDDLARRELGFAPRPLDEAIDACVAWFRRTGLLPRPSPTTPGASPS